MFKLAPISVALALLSMLMLNACGTELHLSDGLAQDSHSAEMTSGPAKQNRQQAGSDFGSAAPHSSGEKGEHGPILSTNCDDTTAGFFAQQVWGGFMAARCAQCHSAGGMAQYYFAFEESLSPASIQHNLEILQGYAGSDYTLPDGSTMPYLLAMPTGNVRDADDNVSHSGGVVINEFDHPIEIENFATLIDILRADDVVLDESCEEADPFVDVEVADAAQTYRQATQLLANRMPQEAAHADMLDAELEGVGDELLDAYLDELMSGMMFPEDEDNFYANLMLWFNDRFFTDKYATGYDAVKALDNLNGAVMPEHFPQTRYFYRNFENNIAYYPSITPQNFFYDRINSIFGHDPDGNGAQKSCKSCHDSTPDAGLRLSNYNYSCANNSDNGPVIVPGDHANSLLWQYVSGNAHADSSEVYQLEQNEVDLIAEWIDTYQACHTELQDNDLYSFWSNAKNATAAAIGREPLNLIKHVVKNNRPFSEILTADYALVNSYSAVSYNVVDLRENGLACLYDEIWADEDRSSCSTEPFSALDNFMPAFAEHGFTEPLDADVYLEKQIQNASGDTANFVPHAGVFTTTTFLKRHDTTSANKNRNRATRTIRHFLGLDIYDYIPPPSDGSGSTSSDPACVSCHSKMDPIAELYQNFDNSALYTPNDNASDWDTPGFSKGYFGDFFDGDDGANLQWLGQKISQDPRFGKGIAGIIFEQLLGRSLKAPIADVNAPDYAIHFTAYRHEQLFLEEVGERFLNEHQGDIRGLIKDIIKSPYFRAIAADGNDIMSTGVNASFMLGPETMNTKNKRILGMEWIRDGANGFTSEFKLLYGGINSTTVLTRQRTATALSANVITTMALQLPQQLLDGDKLDDLLPNSWDSSWEDENLENDVEPTDESVRSDIQHVMARLLGEYCDEDAVELEETMALFTEIKESEGAQIAWKAVLSLLLMDYNYTHSDLVLGQDDGVL